MHKEPDETAEAHIKLILDRYADRENIGILHTPPDVMVKRYLNNIIQPNELNGKVIFELGAGCSQYIPVFLNNRCARYYANDIIPERLAATRVDDNRYLEIPGDFRDIQVPESVDIVFASLTMMLVMPMLDDFVAKIYSILKADGLFLSMDSNYFCPLSVYRRFADRRANPVRLFSPFRYADAFRQQRFEVERLVPFTPPLPWTTGNWLMGTNFWLRARKRD